MDDDIVTQLRAFIPLANYLGDDLHAEHLAEAADEIEDLRAELAECQRQYQKLNKKYTDEIERLRQERDDYKEMHRLAKECLDFIYKRKKWWQV